MNNRGAVGIMVLWILVGCFALATAVIAIARAQTSSPRIRSEESELVLRILSDALADREAGFIDEGSHQFRRVYRAEGRTLKKEIEISWIKNGGRWRADGWVERQ